MIFATVIGTICHIDFARVLIYCVGVKDGCLLIHSVASFDCFTYTKCRKRYIKNGLHSKRFFVKKLKILCSSDRPILFKFHQLMVMVQILQIVF